jgi:hypothetical protein
MRKEFDFCFSYLPLLWRQVLLSQVVCCAWGTRIKSAVYGEGEAKDKYGKEEPLLPREVLVQWYDSPFMAEGICPPGLASKAR